MKSELNSSFPSKLPKQKSEAEADQCHCQEYQTTGTFAKYSYYPREKNLSITVLPKCDIVTVTVSIFCSFCKTFTDLGIMTVESP